MTTLHTAELTNWFLITFMIGSFLHSLITNYLDFANTRDSSSDINKKTKLLHRIHKLMKKVYPLNSIKKGVEYSNEHRNLSDFADSTTSAITSITMLLGLVPTFVYWLINTYPNLSMTTVVIIVSVTVSLIKTAISAFPSYYATFRIEEKYGFNTQNKIMFFIDTIKHFVISNVITSVMIIVANYFLTSFGRYDIKNVLLFAVGMFVFLNVIGFVYSTVIMKMFNKFEPIKNKRLMNALKPVLEAGKYNPKRVFVMDGSRRSNHANAYVTGFGPFRKIVLFDTLVKNYTPNEIASIIGHEIGHAKLGHLMYGTLSSFMSIMFTVAITFCFIYNPSVYQAFGFDWVNDGNIIRYGIFGFVLIQMVMNSVTWIFDPIDSYISRKCEYAADRYSAMLTKKTEPMISSLIKLSSENLSNPFPNRHFEMWNYSHPSLINRINAILKIKEELKGNAKKEGK